MSRMLRAALVLALGLALTLSGCARTQPQPGPGADPRATIGLTYIPSIQFAPFYVAEAEGLLRTPALEGTLRHHGAQEGLFTALAAGQEQYVIAGGDEMLQARAQGMDLVAIAQYYHSYPVVIIVPETSDIATAADLRGRSVGVPGRYGETWFGLLAALADAGLTADDVDIVEVGYTQQAALTSGKVEAIVGFANNEQVAFGLEGIATRAVPLTQDGPVPLVSIVLVTTAANLQRNPQTARAVAAAMVEGMQRTVAAPASAVAAARRHIPTLGTPGAEASALATLQATVPLWRSPDGRATGTMEESDWRAMVDFLGDKGLLDGSVDPGACMTNDYLTP